MKKIVICGASSGIGREIAKIYAAKGYKVGIMGRREDKLLELARNPLFVIKVCDITAPDAPDKLHELIADMGGIDIYMHCSGIGYKNVALEFAKELATTETNCLGFTQMIATAFDYFAHIGHGQIAAISSIAGTKGLGAAPAYSASKRFQRHYLECLAQLAHIRKLDIKITDIRPGFVDTDLLKGGHYPVLLSADAVAQKIVRSVEKHKRAVVIDCRYALVVALWRMLPNFLWERLPIR